MYKYAEQKLLEEIEKLEKEFKPKNEELKNIKAKLENISKYDDLKKENSKYVPMGFAGLIFGSLCSMCAIETIVYFLKTLTFDITLGLIGTLAGTIGIILLYCGKTLLNDLKPNNKEIKELKQKGIKKDKKEKAILLAKEKEIEEEKKINQDKINEINTVLEHINFYNETVNNLFFQADTKEEYDLVLDKDGYYEELFNEYLEEKIDYSNIHFDSIPSEITLPNEEISLRKIYK